MSPFESHLKSEEDLVTSRTDVRAGFVALALERNRKAAPHIAVARALKATATKVGKPLDLLELPEIRPALLTAAGVSDKAAGHFDEEDKTEAILGLITKFLDPAGDAFVEELVFRFLLTRGDTLGGSMRNIGGAMAQRKLSRAILAALSLTGIPYTWLRNGNRNWVSKTEDDTDIEYQLRAVSWSGPAGPRTIIYNFTVPAVQNNIDMCLLACLNNELESHCQDAANYLALGELKGGIDPAGADEHWKTARTALDRIRVSFEKAKLAPATFFVGAAVERKMAAEIWAALKDGKLANAANLTRDEQVASLCNWLISL